MENNLEKLLNGIIGFLPTLLFATVIYIAGAFINKVILKLFAKGTEKSRMDKTVRKFLESVIKIIVTAVVLITVLTILGIPMTSIITVLGTAGVAVGLALKDSLSNVAGGVILLLSRTVKVGDYIETGGYSGTVDEVSILFTKLSTPDNKDIFIPNGIMSTSAITNYSSEDMRRVDMVFSVSYGSDHRKAVSAVNEVIEKHPLILKEQPVFVRLGELSSSSLDIKARVWTKSGDYWTVYFDLIEQVKDKFDEAGIVIPYNQLDVHIETKESKV